VGIILATAWLTLRPARAEPIVAAPLLARPILGYQVTQWVESNYSEHFQKYSLSCEAAVISWALKGLEIPITEDEILAKMPRHNDNPRLGMVIDDINGNVFNEDGSINWRNYGAHAPVVAKVINQILQEVGYRDEVCAVVQRLTDAELTALVRDNPDCLGVVIWVARSKDGKDPPVHVDGRVLGEHVQWVVPKLDAEGRLLVYDVWPWPAQPFRLYQTYNRRLFDWETVVIYRGH
jgi:hypothetical protein